MLLSPVMSIVADAFGDPCSRDAGGNIKTTLSMVSGAPGDGEVGGGISVSMEENPVEWKDIGWSIIAIHLAMA
jgi:hypothetical protein